MKGCNQNNTQVNAFQEKLLTFKLAHALNTMQSEDLGGNLPLYSVLFSPHDECCLQSWAPKLRKDVKVLERIQRRGPKLVKGLEEMSCEERL